MYRKKPARKQRKAKKPYDIKNVPDAELTVSENKDKGKALFSEDDLHQLFAKCSDIHFQQMEFGPISNNQVMLVNCEGMVDKEMLNQSVYPKLEIFFQNNQDTKMTKEMILHSLHLPDLSLATSKERIIADVFSGKIVLYFKNSQYLFTADIAKRPQRMPEETRTEVSVKGPRDNFIEDLAINVALVRKRLRTTSLKVEKFEVGRRSLTSISLLFIEDIASKHITDEIRKCLKNINVDAIYSGNQLMELIEKAPLLIPKHSYTGHPDFAVESLLNGRCVILIDGIAYANIVPTNLFFLLKSSGDSEYSSFYSSFERIIRIIGILFAAYLPPFWVAITTFHQNQLPLSLLAPVVESRRGLPLPTGMEAIAILLVFELLKEAGLRMPQAIGFTVSVVGGLIIGEAAIDARLTSPAMLVIIALSTVSTFTFVSQTLIGAVSLLRIFTVIFASFFGLFGFTLSLIFIIVYISNLRVFGFPYMEMFANLNFLNILKAIFRLPANGNTQRPVMIFSQDNTPKGKKSK